MFIDSLPSIIIWVQVLRQKTQLTNLTGRFLSVWIENVMIIILNFLNSCVISTLGH